MISYSAPAKVILSGDHAVVYGAPALYTSLNLRLTVRLDEKGTYNDEQIKDAVAIVEAYCKKRKVPYEKKSFGLHISSEIPSGRNLGSSAAYSVAVTAAIYEHFTRQQPTKEIVNALAYIMEKKFHKNPSGGDNSVVCFGGLVFYRREFEFLKTISALHAKIPQNISERLFLIDSGKPKEKTAELVEMVGKKYNADPEKMSELMHAIEKVTKRMVISLVKEDSNFFRQQIIDNQKYLTELGVVSNKAIALLEELNSVGVGKVTGAGGQKEGSGFMLFFSDDPENLRAILDKKNIAYFPLVADWEGLRKEI